MVSLKRCDGFGSKFDESSDVCMMCEDAVECMNKLIEDELNVREGKKPPTVQTYTFPSPPPIMVMLKNIPENGKIKMEIYLDMEWLKKRLGLDKK
jgi:hypothetical protein